MIRSSEWFSFDDVYSSQYGIKNVTIDTGMYEEHFTRERKIIEKKIKGRSKPYYKEIESEPLTIPVTFAFMNSWDDSSIREVIRWLTSPTQYKPLIFSQNPSKIYYALAVDKPDLIHNGLSQGYVQMTFRCNDAYAYSPIYLSQIYDLTSNPIYTDIQLTNNGDEIIYPEIFVDKIGIGDFSIQNLSNSGETLLFEDLSDGEELYIDGENEQIETNLLLTDRYDNHNNIFLSFPLGVNTLRVYGNIKLRFRYQEKFM